MRSKVSKFVSVPVLALAADVATCRLRKAGEMGGCGRNINAADLIP
jgi:hypothetical protein